MIHYRSKKVFYVVLSAVLVIVFAFASANLVSTLGISNAATTTIMKSVNAGLAVVTIVSIAASIGTIGLSTALVIAAKKIAKKYGTKIPIVW